jgi:hypothetical protein
VIYTRCPKAQILTRNRSYPKFRRVVTGVCAFLKCPKMGCLGPPEVSRVMETRLLLEIHSDCVIFFKSLQAFLMFFNVKIRQIIHPINDTRVFVVVSDTFRVKV